MSVRLRIYKDHTATLAGINYQDLRGIFDWAMCALYEDKKRLRAKKSRTKQEEEQLQYLDGMLQVAEEFLKATNAAIAASFPKHTRTLSKVERYDLIREERRERLLIESIIQMALSETKRT